MKVEKVPDSTYDMVGGCDKQIKEIKEVIELPIKHPELFESLGVAQPKGVLLYGPPGTGKTLLARAVANNIDANFLKVVASAIVDKYIGESARLIREMFGYARDHEPCIIFMDSLEVHSPSRVQEYLMAFINCERAERKSGEPALDLMKKPAKRIDDLPLVSPKVCRLSGTLRADSPNRRFRCSLTPTTAASSCARRPTTSARTPSSPSRRTT